MIRWDNVRATLLAVALAPTIAIPAIAAPESERPVPPGFPYKGRFLNIMAPNSEGWQLVSDQPSRWTFAKRGSDPDASYIASITKFAVPSTISRDDFMALVRKGVEQEENADRFKNVHSVLEFSDARRYLCVHYRATADDTQAKVGSEETQPLFFEMDGLYCQDPLMTNAGFAAIYSYRGNQADPQFEKQASEFIAGIQVPGY
jgi:hypothetical protein